MNYQGLPKRVIEKHRIELVELHKRCIKAYLVQKDLSYKNRLKFFKLYDMYIDHKNIEEYFNIPINFFIQGLIKDTLHNLFIYTTPDVRKDRKKSVRRKGKN